MGLKLHQSPTNPRTFKEPKKKDGGGRRGEKGKKKMGQPVGGDRGVNGKRSNKEKPRARESSQRISLWGPRAEPPKSIPALYEISVCVPGNTTIVRGVAQTLIVR